MVDGPTTNANDLRQEQSMVALLASALDDNAKGVPARVNAKRAEMDAELAISWQGDAKRAFDEGATLLQQRVQEVANHVSRLAEGVQSAGTKVAGSDADTSSSFKGLISSGLG